MNTVHVTNTSSEKLLALTFRNADNPNHVDHYTMIGPGDTFEWKYDPAKTNLLSVDVESGEAVTAEDVKVLIGDQESRLRLPEDNNAGSSSLVFFRLS